MQDWLFVGFEYRWVLVFEVRLYAEIVKMFVTIAGS